MNGAHDMGGMHGFGPVVAEPNEPVFHAEWEKRAFALTLATNISARWNIDLVRFVRENRHPAEYLSMSYYQIWFAALEAMSKKRALVTEDEIVAGHALEQTESSQLEHVTIAPEGGNWGACIRAATPRPRCWQTHPQPLRLLKTESSQIDDSSRQRPRQ